MMFAGTGVWKSKRGTPLLGRRCVFINDEHYDYNVRDELIAADEVSYAYDDIGNRTTAEGKTYTANNLNQYTAIDDFRGCMTPKADARRSFGGFEPRPYYQVFAGKLGFIPDLSCVDLLFNMGPEAVLWL